MAFSPVTASQHIKEKYYRYLKTIFRIGEPYQAEFERLLDNGDLFAKGPYLDVTDAFTKGNSLEALIAESLLPKRFARIRMNQTRPLYAHQEKSIRKIAQDERNLVVSTGTGSGKTESFLIPILRELVMEDEAGTLTPGVRALLLYPMNALANDQTERLRELLEDYPAITFGVYTGQTEQEYDKALAEYKSLNNNQTPLPNELISRDQMIKTPPHILITNYAMLEYLMVRPKENVFFEGPYAENWKFIVFDEAHVYHGSTGIEVSLLFRRLKAKLGDQAITYILTSATLGDKDSDKQVAEFAHTLCDAEFSEDDIVRADRIIPAAQREKTELPVSFYEKIAAVLRDNKPDNFILGELGKSGNLGEALYDIVVHDRNYWKIRSLLTSPDTVAHIASEMGWGQDQLTDFVTVAARAEKDGGKLFDARYHMFLRAAESVFVTLAPDNHVMLNRQEFRSNAGTQYKVFEAAVCSYCHAVYLVGKIDEGRLKQYNASDEVESKQLFLLANSISDTDSDHALEDEGIAAEKYEICPYCGFIRKNGSKVQCEHDPAAYVSAFHVDVKTESHTLTKCLRCENTNSSGVLRMFFSGQEAATSVIGTALFEELPSYKVTWTEEAEEEDDFGIGTGGGAEEHREKTAKQFIAFSDSRQAAAFYASYLNISYNSILYKRLIMEALRKLHGKCPTVPEFADRLRTEFEQWNIHGKTDVNFSSEYNLNKEAWKAILAELVDHNGVTSLSRYGLIGIDVNAPGKFPKYDISEAEFRDLCSELILSMLADAAVQENAEPHLNQNDIEDYTHGVIYSYTLSDPQRKYRKAFLPARAGMTNRRVDYAQRVFEKKGFVLNNDEVAEFLKKIWDQVFVSSRTHILVPDGEGGYKAASEKILISKPEHWYICNKCRRLTHHNIASVCPSYHCTGELVPVNPDERFRDNHYYRLYQEMEIRDLTVVEHTAQLNREMAYDYQKQFKQKKIDVLSCSTTFEMGVDVGTLETVFMRNIPPLPSNYAQRAGRAGRSSQSAAYALTFCNKSSHDFTYFTDPTRMIKGRIDPPVFTVENDRIAVRHLYASAFGFWWRAYPQYFKTIGDYLTRDDQGMTGEEHFSGYLQSKPENLRSYLYDFVPQALHRVFGIADFDWVEGLTGQDGVLTTALAEYKYEVDLLEEYKRSQIERGGPVDNITQRINAYRSENIISFLSRKNILPQYGFPVDTVEMTVSAGKNRRRLGLQLQRDLAMAISEYAPGSQIVANNNLITSQYIRKIPNIGWKMYSYVQCEGCRTLNVKPFTEDDRNSRSIPSCSSCGMGFKGSPKVFLIPAQGFAADGDKIRKPGLKKPERTYRGESAYVGTGEGAVTNRYQIGNTAVEVITSHNDELALLNKSNFFVCEQCGYAEIDQSTFTHSKSEKHRNSGGYPCVNNRLKQFSLGYRFKTDVVRIRFVDIPIDMTDTDGWDRALSILYGFLRGACATLNIEENDIAGCLQYERADGRPSVSMVIYDSTPGGSGQAKRLDDPFVLEQVLRNTLDSMKRCTCGGENGDSSCYSCLRSYKNQRDHDRLKRQYVIEYLNRIR